ncbi:MAG: hypothetical protein D6702_01615 [Planctomycetota bacterium]|nr:MAG: hypothetical protein D6702_01615 [Planctomycetota bacterium]
MIAVVLLALAPQALPLDRAPAGNAAQELETSRPEQAREWWRSLSPEERELYRRRFEELRRLDPEERIEMQRRAEAIQLHRRRVWAELPEEERKRLAALPESERLAELDGIVRERLRRRHEELRRRFGPVPPGAGPGPEELPRRPLPERLDASGRIFERLAGEDLDQELARLHEEGWIGDRAAEWLAQAPVAERAAALLDARKWRLLAEAARDGLFERWGLAEADRRRLAEMPSRECLVAMGELRRGLPKEQVFAPRGPLGPPPFPGERFPRRGAGWRPGQGPPPDRGATPPRRRRPGR